MRFFFRLTAPKCPGMAAGAVSLRKSHDIVILSFCIIVKGQAKYYAPFLTSLRIVRFFRLIRLKWPSMKNLTKHEEVRKGTDQARYHMRQFMFAISLQMISPNVKNEWKGLGNNFDFYVKITQLFYLSLVFLLNIP